MTVQCSCSLLKQMISDIFLLAELIPNSEYRRLTRRSAHFLIHLSKPIIDNDKLLILNFSVDRKYHKVSWVIKNLELQAVSCIDLVFRYWSDEIKFNTNIPSQSELEPRFLADKCFQIRSQETHDNL